MTAAACATASFCTLAVGPPAQLAAASQQETQLLADSFTRIKRELESTPAERLRFDLQRPVATFKVEVEQRGYMLSFDEWLRKGFELTPFQRQSQEWRSRCCGINLLNLGGVTTKLNEALRRREARQIREQVARELAQLEANSKK